MVDWSVEGLGAVVTVTSPLGDAYPFAITCRGELRIALRTAPRWGSGREPADAAARIERARGIASRWTDDTFGPAPRRRPPVRAGGAARAKRPG